MPRGHRVLPDPGLHRAEATLTTPGGGLRTSVGTGWGTHSMDLEYLELRYGRVLLDDRREWVRVRLRPAGPAGRLSLLAALARTRMWTRGTLEFWPFTPTIVDLLGLRRNMSGRLAVTDASLGAEWSMGSPSGGAAGVSAQVHRTGTDGALTSWEPVVLGLGRTNVISDLLDVRSIWLLDVGLSLGLDLGEGRRLEAGVLQLLPVAVDRRESAVSGGGGDGGASADHAGGLRWWVSLQISAVGQSR